MFSDGFIIEISIKKNKGISVSEHVIRMLEYAILILLIMLESEIV